jgi:hypothetical protein
MANPNRGEVALAAGGRAYKLSFSVNALCELEEELDKPVAEIVAAFQDEKHVRLGSIRVLLWAALRDHHDEVTIKEAGLIATDAGIQPVVEAIGQAFRLAFPEAKGSANPRKAKAG